MVAEALAAAVVAMPMVMRLVSNGLVAGLVATHLCRCGRVRVIWHGNLKMIHKNISEKYTTGGRNRTYLTDQRGSARENGSEKRNSATN